MLIIYSWIVTPSTWIFEAFLPSPVIFLFSPEIFSSGWCTFLLVFPWKAALIAWFVTPSPGQLWPSFFLYRSLPPFGSKALPRALGLFHLSPSGKPLCQSLTSLLLLLSSLVVILFRVIHAKIPNFAISSPALILPPARFDLTSPIFVLATFRLPSSFLFFPSSRPLYLLIPPSIPALIWDALLLLQYIVMKILLKT